MISMTPGTPGTLTVQGIPWFYTKHNDKVAFGFGHHAIIFNNDLGCYCIMQDGESAGCFGGVAECLERASDIVFDYYADRIIPSWEEN